MRAASGDQIKGKRTTTHNEQHFFHWIFHFLLVVRECLSIFVLRVPCTVYAIWSAWIYRVEIEYNLFYLFRSLNVGPSCHVRCVYFWFGYVRTMWLCFELWAMATISYSNFFYIHIHIYSFFPSTDRPTMVFQRVSIEQALNIQCCGTQANLAEY